MIYKRHDKEHLEELKNGTSKLFPIVPKEIGEIVYCTTDNLGINKSEKDVKKNKAKELTKTILIVAAIVGFFCLSGVIYLPIAAGVIGLVIIVRKALENAKFQGQNEILGTEGFVIQYFENSRDNIRLSVVYKFSDIFDIIVESTYKLINGFIYSGSEKNYNFWKWADKNSKWPTFNRKVYYDKNDIKEIIDAVPINFEELWTNYRLKKIRPIFDNNEMVYFNYFVGSITYEVHENYIGISKDSLIIDGKVCNKENIKNVRFNNGLITIKTDRDGISLKVSGIGSFMAFQELFFEFVKNNLPIGVYASIGGDAETALKQALKEQGFDI